MIDGTLTSLSGLITGDPPPARWRCVPNLSGRARIGPVGTATVMVAPSAITAGSTYFLSDVGSTVIPAFTGGTLQVDTNGQTYGTELHARRLGHQPHRPARQQRDALRACCSDAVPGTPGNVIIANSGIGGRIVLSGVNTYSGTTLIDAGATLAVDGSIVSPVTVNGTLRGTGLIGGSTTIASGGTLAPGDSPGTLTFAAPVVMSPGATLRSTSTGRERARAPATTAA